MAINRYDYPSFPGFADVRLFRERLDLKVGDEAPDFTGNMLETGSIVLSQLTDLAHVVLEFGSITSPQFCAGVPELQALRAEFEPKGFRFFVVYTRECHPAENYPQHSSYEDKVRCANASKRFQLCDAPVCTAAGSPTSAVMCIDHCRAEDQSVSLADCGALAATLPESPQR